MKLSSFFKIAAMAVLLTTVSCRSHKKVVNENPVVSSPEQVELLDKVESHAQKNATFVGSKIKFSVTVGDQDISLTGNLRMKRDDVIRLQLMAFGFVEAARLEFTQDYVLIMDRINKLYLKAPYYYIDFLRNSGINFNTLQALFWDELFQPGKTDLTDEDRQKYTTQSLGDGDALINFEDGDGETIRSKMFYSWLVNETTGRIKMANIMYRDASNGNTQLNWDYRDFKNLGSKLFPSDMAITLTTPQKEVKLGLKLNYLNNDNDWELRTRVSDKYREVEIDEILRRFMAL
ncbi:MAG: DUF4292 domain-containing protein [Prevotella sp.]|jgi:hypothetical protein|nr:DUF4292 domain-containing protein [Prevotella sp.]